MKRNMIYLYCADCKKSFAALEKQRKRYFCPYCGENTAIEKVNCQKKGKGYSPWSEAEENLLVEQSKTMFLYEIADQLGRSENSVRRKLEELRKKGVAIDCRRSIKKYGG